MSERTPAESEYTYRAAWSPEDAAYLGQCVEFPALSAFGDSLEEALTEIRSVVAESIDILKEDSEAIPEPFSRRNYSGRLSLRIPPATHRLAAIEAAEQGVSLNQYLTSRIESGLAPPTLARELASLRHAIHEITRALNAGTPTAMYTREGNETAAPQSQPDDQA